MPKQSLPLLFIITSQEEEIASHWLSYSYVAPIWAAWHENTSNTGAE